MSRTEHSTGSGTSDPRHMEALEDGPPSVKKFEAELPLARFFFIVVGIGYLFPYSALTQPVDYWELLFPDYDIEFMISAVYMWTNFILLFLIVFFGSTKPDYDLRFYWGFLGQFFSLLLVPTSYFWGMSETGNYIVVMICTVFAALVTSFIDSCMISLAGRYPNRYGFQEALQIGIGISVLIGSVYRIMTKLIVYSTATVTASLFYFYSGAGTVLFCIYCYWALNNMEITKIALAESEAIRSRSNSIASQPRSRSNSASESGSGRGRAGSDLGLSLSRNNSSVRLYGTAGTEGAASAEEVQGLIQPGAPADAENQQGRPHMDSITEAQMEPRSRTSSRASLTRNDSVESLSNIYDESNKVTDFEKRNVAFMKVWWNEMMVLSSFGITFMLFPGMISIIPSYDNVDLNDAGWWSLILLFIFSSSDVVGRNSTHIRLGLTADNIHYAILARGLFFIPTIIFCVTGIFASDFLSILIVALLGFTNGYIGPLAIVLVNELCAPEDRGTVGSLTSLALNAGIVVGATVAIFLGMAF